MTVEEEGLKEKVCTVCGGAKIQETIEKLPQLETPEEVDKTSAQEYYDACLVYYVKGHYSEESFAVYEAAMDALKLALENEEITVEELQAAVNAVSEATDALAPVVEQEPEKEPETDKPSSPVTGDTSMMMVYAMMIVIAAVVIFQKKREF